MREQEERLKNASPSLGREGITPSTFPRMILQKKMTTAEPKVNPSLAAATFLPPLPQGKGTGLSLALLREGGMHPPALGAG